MSDREVETSSWISQEYSLDPFTTECSILDGMACNLGQGVPQHVLQVGQMFVDENGFEKYCDITISSSKRFIIQTGSNERNSSDIVEYFSDRQTGMYLLPCSDVEIRSAKVSKFCQVRKSSGVNS